MSTTLKENRGKLEERRKALHDVFEQAGPDNDMSKVTALEGDTAAKLEQIRAMNDEITDLSAEVREAEGLMAIRERVDELGEVDRSGRALAARGAGAGAGDRGREERQPSLGEMFVASDSYKNFETGEQGSRAGIEADWLTLQAATFTTATATLTSYDRQPPMVLVGTQRLTVADLLAKGQTNQNTIRYVQEDTYTNAATTVTEGNTKPEATFDTSEVDAPVRKIAVTAKVTDEMFNDFPAMQSYIDMRLRFMVAQYEETQLLNGNGTPPNITGILQTSGIQTQPTGSDDNQDALYKAITKVRAIGFFEPDGVVLHPDNWTPIRLLRTIDGQYVWGPPSVRGPESVWGLPAVVTTAITTGTGLVGAFQLGAQVFYREGIRVESTNSNEDDFKKNLIAIRAEQREALAVYRPKAFCTTTSMGT